MILINLLPHREERRRRRRVAFFVGLGVAAAFGALIVAVWYLVLQQLTDTQQQRNQFLRNEITTLESQIKDIANLKAEIEGLKARQRAVEDLQTNRNVPVHLLNELVKQTPEGVYLTSIKQADRVVTVAGIAQTNERVSEMLRNAGNDSPWLEKPELVEIKASTQNKDPSRRLYDFSMRLYVKNSTEPAAGAASAPPAGKPAAAKP